VIINNKSGCLVIGRVARDPETRQTTSNSVTKFSIIYDQDATKTLENGKHPSKFMDIDAWGTRGTVAAQTIQKGDNVMVAGQLRSREYEGKTYWSVTADIIVPSLSVINAIIPEETCAEGAYSQQDAKNATLQMTETDDTFADDLFGGSDEDIPF
jgi:single stranded DNA-binding protein